MSIALGSERFSTSHDFFANAVQCSASDEFRSFVSVARPKPSLFFIIMYGSHGLRRYLFWMILRTANGRPVIAASSVQPPDRTRELRSDHQTQTPRFQRTNEPSHSPFYLLTRLTFTHTHFLSCRTIFCSTFWPAVFPVRSPRRPRLPLSE